MIRPTYQVRAHREFDGNYFGVWVPELDTVGQSPVEDGDAGIERAAREVIGLWLDASEDSFDVAITKGADYD